MKQRLKAVNYEYIYWMGRLGSKVLAEPVLVGREQELDLLHRFLELASEGQGKTVFISAEAGIGKTRLISEFLGSAKQDKNIVTLSGWCLFNAGVPYFPFIEAFSNYYSASGGKRKKEELEINSWLKGFDKNLVSGKLEYLSPQALKDRAFATVAKTIHSIAAQNPVILVVEDIHWADSASLALLHYIARSVHDSERVLVLATFRSEELTNDSQGYPHQLVETLTMMRREDLFETMSLPHLNPNSIAKMAESMLDGILRQGLAEKLSVKSEGNPLFVVESLRMLHEQGKLVKENNEWHLAVEEIEIPSKIKDIVIQRLAYLNSAQRRILDAASVIGDEFENGLLSAVIGQDSLDVLETLNIIAHSTSLVCADEDRFRFDHARSREIIYEALSKPLRQGYHIRIAETIEGSRSAALPLSDLAYHFAKAGNKKKAVEYALAAGQDELAKFSNAQAIEHFQYVVQNGSAETDEEKTVALEGLGDAYAANSMYAEAIKTFDELASSVIGILKLRALRKASDSSFHLWDPKLLIDYAKKAEDLAGYNRLEMARIICNRGRAWGSLGKNVDYGADYADFKAGLDVFEEENSLADVGEALWRCGITGRHGGESEESMLEKHLRSVAILKDLGDVRKGAEANLYLGFHFFSLGLFSEARNALSCVLEAGKNLGLFAEMTMAFHWMSMIEEIEGKTGAAISNCLKAQEYEKKTDARWAKGFPSALTRLYAMIGDMEKADEYFEKTIKSFPEDFAFNNPFFFVHISKGVYFAAKGLWKESSCAFKEYEQSLQKQFGEPEHELHFRVYYAWALERQGRFQDATVQLDKAQEFLKRVEERFSHANILLSPLMPRKVQVEEEFEVRLDIVNVARTPCFLVKVEGLIPYGSKVVSLPSFCSIGDNSIEMKTRKIKPFEVESIRIKLAFANAGEHDFHPCLLFTTDQDEIKNSEAKSIIVKVETRSSENEAQTPLGHHKFVFESEHARKAFDFLVSAFTEDYYKRRLPQEKSGWRTLMEIVKNGQVSMNSMYGRSGKGGKAKLEMIRAGLVETRFFLGERGRGGSVLKMRIRCENETLGVLINKNTLDTKSSDVAVFMNNQK